MRDIKQTSGLGWKNKLKAEIGMRIRDKMEKAQECDNKSNCKGEIEEMEFEDLSEQNDITLNKGSMFSFVAL